MTETAEATGKSVRTVRMHDETWNLMQSRRGMTASTLINDMTEAGLGFARCYRCFEPVPVEFGDLTGKPLAEWVAEAGKAVTAQHRDGHHPVTIGNGPAQVPPESPALQGRKLQPGSRASRTLAVLASHPDGLPTPEIAKIMGDHPQALSDIARLLRREEGKGVVTGTRLSGHPVIRWKITERGMKMTQPAP